MRISLKILRAVQFNLDLRDCEVPDRKIALELLAACHRNLCRLGDKEYKRARNEALEDALIVGTIVDSEWYAYKTFMDRRFQRKAKEAIQLKYRPRTPIHALEDGRS